MKESVRFCPNTKKRESLRVLHASAYALEFMTKYSSLELQNARELVSDASNAELLGAMAAKDTDPSLAKAALEEFTTRHRLYIFRACSNLVDRYGTASGWEASEFAKAVFAKIYSHANTYRDIDQLNEDQRLKRLKGWMGKIANNLLIDRRRRIRDILFKPDFLAAIKDPGASYDFPTRTHELICEAVRQLPDRERLVIIRTLRYTHSSRHQRLPNNVCAELRGELHTTSANIRQIRKRAKSYLKAYFSQRGEDIRLFD